MTVPFKVKAVYEYKSAEPDDLTFPNGQIITVTDDADEDWYTGEYTAASGEHVEGLFPRNFVERYEPAVPSRPARAAKRAPAPAPEPEPEPLTPSAPPPADPTPEPVAEPEHEPETARDAPQAVPKVEEAAPPQPAEPVQSQGAPAAEPKSPPTKAAPPPIASKPKNNAFMDRIAAFNKPAAAPIAPFKPGGSAASGFIKKPFVAPPPSKNAYVPPPREPPPQKVYQREEEQADEPSAERSAPPPPRPLPEAEDEDQPKPTSLKERIALLQKQQMEQAQRQADPATKKEKPKKPPKKRTEPSEEAPVPAAEPPLERLDTNETVGKKSSDLTEDIDSGRPSFQRGESAHSVKATPQPPRELVSDTNDADDSGAADTEDAQETSTEEERPRSKGGVTSTLPEPKKQTIQKPEPQDDEEDEEDEEEDTEEEEDPEVRRKRELRERMAKMSGGMGMMGMFGSPGGAAPAPRKPRASQEHSRETEQHAQEEATRAPPVPIMALPGMSNQLPRRPAEPVESDSEEDDDKTEQPTPREQVHQSDADDDYVSQPPPPPRRSETMRSSASIDRPAPPPPPQRVQDPTPAHQEGRAVPPPPPSTNRAVPPQPPVVTEDLPDSAASAASPRSPPARRSTDRPLSSAGAPPVPPNRSRPEPTRKQSTDPAVSSPMQSPQTRAPPPPPPGQPPSRHSTAETSGLQADEDSENEVSEYDGDYDTDIASSAKHKDALKAHQRDSSIDEGTLTDEATKSPKNPPHRSIPPLPPIAAHQNAPPPPPPQAPAPSRKSTDAPRAPPPVPPPAAMPQQHDDDDYDPYRYNSPQGLPTPQLNDVYKTLSRDQHEEPETYGAQDHPTQPPPPPREDRPPPPRPPVERAAPPPPPSDRSVPPPPPVPDSPRAEIARPAEPRRSGTMSRRSMEAPRPSGEGFMAQDIDLHRSSFWWTQNNLIPPSLANRPDILYEMEENTSNKRGGQANVSKDVYVLYSDYSQTTINATFDKADPSQVTLEQKHDRPPPPPRKDQLEAASERYGAPIASAATNYGNQGATVGDGSPFAFVSELIKTLPTALRPVGVRAYGALVYGNMSNASVQQFDEIRAGDIVSFRNAKFGGHKGKMHQKYTVDVGKPDHVAVVVQWDGSKKKLGVWEQRSEEDRKEKKRAKVRDESYRLEDLKSGEVRIWRVMGRDYVGWDKS
ncbi:SH3 domain-containing protein C23A1.17 [Cyphellophora attinorum]|uniref:SH3 domain-containing protein C23A1.17 n=1 Tax=Cyphellophora attinorum TaxID=1664694 RepID=A0A0N1H7A0_9EURO|nr:SH3 domain-containing protein C23A1.17 [Phialophora attinorum]KPI42322.1 SH3 domain-containing protein C23A1.17 [Phialophora attinorum]